MDRKRITGIAAILAAVIILALISGNLDTSSNKSSQTADSTATEVSSAGSSSASAESSGKAKTDFAETESIDEKHLRDVDTLYEDQKDTAVTTMYLTVSSGNEDDGTNHTWKQVNTHSAEYYENKGIDRYKVEGLLQVGDENGPVSGEFGADQTVPNATVQIRGQSSSLNAQKNYKIRIKKNHGNWNGQRTIALNKHMSEGLRYRNKLGFDMLRKIPQLMSLRTSFVHLYVRDMTKGGNGKFTDYGLYTQVEQLNKTALRAHGLDKNGQLYKINYFEFYRYPDIIKKADDSDYDKNRFEQYLEIKGSEDHSKLIKMLNDLNDYTIPVDDIIEKYFDRENLAYWMAYNLLTGNVDTQSRNAYLYSPLNGNTWYLLCWDLDGNMAYTEERTRDRSGEYLSWQRGVSNYWGNILFRRCLMSSKFRKALDAAVQDIRKNDLNKDTLKKMNDQYRKVVKPYVYRMPDQEHAPLTSSQYDYVADRLPELPAFYYRCYRLSLKKPMPFYIGTPTVKGKKTVLNWDASYDFDNEKLTYHAVLSRDPLMKHSIKEYRGEAVTTSTGKLSPGQYFLKVTVTNSSGYSQDAFDIYTTEDYKKHFGTICFYVDKKGHITRDVPADS